MIQPLRKFLMLAERDVKLFAVIGSATVISAAKKYSDKRYTFENVKDGTVVKDWDEILNLLQPDEPDVKPAGDGGQNSEDSGQMTEE